MFALLQGQTHLKRRGRLKKPPMTSYLIGNDTMLHKTKGKKREDLSQHHWTPEDKRMLHKTKGKKREDLSQHHWTPEDKRIMGHSLVQGLFVVLGWRCPLAP